MSDYKTISKKELNTIYKTERVGEENINNQGLHMKIIKYIDASNIEVMFDDGNTEKTSYYSFRNGKTRNTKHKWHIGEVRYNNQNCKMMVIDYYDKDHILVEFQDDYKAKVTTSYYYFTQGKVFNPNVPGKYGEVTGNIYPTKINGLRLKEYNTWRGIFERVFLTDKEKNKSYIGVTICKEWYYYPNFVDWVRSQPNYELWKNNSNWAIDKDILSDPNNKIYSPETCCLVPRFVNDSIRMFHKEDGMSNGICRNGKGYAVRHVLNGKTYFTSQEEALQAYKEYKRDKIDKAANLAYEQGLITQRCYEGLLNYTNY